jgi:pyridine nucleotide-disulfide oxidoreductase family protein
MTATAPQAAPQAPRKHLLLVGAGHAHLHVLQMLAQHRPAQLDVTLLTPDAWQTYSGMVPGYVAGRYALDACRIALQPLLRTAGVTWIQGLCTGIDAAQSQVTLQTTGSSQQAPQTLRYDLLSLDTGAVFDPIRLAADMPGSLEHTLPVRPIDDFIDRWQARMEQRQPSQKLPHTVTDTSTWAFIGAGAASIELLMAAHQRLAAATEAERAGGNASRIQLVLVTGGSEVAAGYAPGIQRRVLRQLAKRQVQVVRQRCVGAQPGALQLEDGSLLFCDGAVLAVGTHAPRWLQGSGLALAETGHLRVNPYQQSTSHANVFAAGDVATREDAPHPKSGVYAVRAGPPLARNLLAAASAQPLKPYLPPARTLNLLSCGTGHAILSWGPLHAEGTWAWWLKDKIDRAFVARYVSQA